MLHSKIKEILEEKIAGDEGLASKKDKFHTIEFEIDNIIKKMIKKKEDDGDYDPEDDFKKMLERTKTLIEREFGFVWMDKNWASIKREIEDNLRELKK